MFETGSIHRVCLSCLCGFGVGGECGVVGIDGFGFGFGFVSQCPERVHAGGDDGRGAVSDVRGYGAEGGYVGWGGGVGGGVERGEDCLGGGEGGGCVAGWLLALGMLRLRWGVGGIGDVELELGLDLRFDPGQGLGLEGIPLLETWWDDTPEQSCVLYPIYKNKSGDLPQIPPANEMLHGLEVW